MYSRCAFITASARMDSTMSSRKSSSVGTWAGIFSVTLTMW